MAGLVETDLHGGGEVALWFLEKVLETVDG
jgi:hypothetical protein